jgi:hypothetical protein
MIPLVIGFLAAATIVSWFFRGGTKRPASETRSERGSATGDSVADETSTATLEVESFPDPAPFEQTEAAPVAANGVPEEEQPPSLDEPGPPAESLQEEDLAHQEAEPRLDNDGSGAMLTMVESARPNEPLPSANVEEAVLLPAGQTSLEHEDLPAGNGVSLTSEQLPGGEPMVPEDNCLVVCESAIDALSFSVLFPDGRTRYASIGGKMNPAQPDLIRGQIECMPSGSEIVAVMDADEAGRALAEVVRRQVELSGRDVRFRSQEPSAGFRDFNDELRGKPKAPLPYRLEVPSVA